LAGLGYPSYFQLISRIGSVTARYSSSGRQPNFAVLNRGRHLQGGHHVGNWPTFLVSIRLLTARGYHSTPLATMQFVLSLSCWFSCPNSLCTVPFESGSTHPDVCCSNTSYCRNYYSSGLSAESYFRIEIFTEVVLTAHWFT